MLSNETIAAISTPAGTGAIAIVRLSGSDAWKIAREVFCITKQGLQADEVIWKSHRALHGFLKDRANALVDEVVIIPYKGPNSYTGEDLVEINCHGGAVVTSEVLGLCLARGARLARPGEFTQRAFLNGRIDLTQAEAVLDVIQAKTSRQSRLALSALKGEIGEQIYEVRRQLVELLGRIVAGIDFPEEVGEIPIGDVSEIVARSLSKLTDLSETTRSGRFLREGLKIAIVGKPNAGKSSLLNQLLKFERAIVTDVPGTTRDSLEEVLDLNGIPVILIDTAGIRHTADTVEKIGVERAHKAVEQADMALLVFDAAHGWTTDDETVLETLTGKTHVLLANKMDLIQPSDLTAWPHDTNAFCIERLGISAKTGSGIKELKAVVEQWVFHDGHSIEQGGSLNKRQGELCDKAVKSLKLVQETARSNMPQDCLATDIKLAIDSLSEICGEAVSEEIITDIFARFCIGK